MASDEADNAEEEQEELRFGCLRSFSCGASSVNCVAFFGDADHILVGTSDRTVFLLSAQHGILHEFVGGRPRLQSIAGEHTDVVSCIGSTDSLTDLFLSGGLDKRAPVNTCLFRPSPSPLTHVAAIGDAEGRVRIFDIRGQNNRFGYVQVLADAKDGISSILATEDKLLVASLDGCIYTYDLRKGILHADSYGSPITCLSLSADQTVLLTSCMDASVRLIEASSGECLHAFWGHRQTATGAFRLCSDFLTSSRRLPSTSFAGDLFSTDLSASSKEPPRAFDELLEVVERCKQSSGGVQAEIAAQLPYAISGSEDCCVYIWDVQAAASGEAAGSGESGKRGDAAGQQGVHGRAHDAPTLVVRVHSLSQRLCTAATDGTVSLWRQL